jgi:hypothetical protein
MSNTTQKNAHVNGYLNSVPVTPSDANDLPTEMKIAVAATGNVVVQDRYGRQTTWTGVAAGVELPGLYKRVLSTGTTATVVGLY